jgi:hypothetical protein
MSRSLCRTVCTVATIPGDKEPRPLGAQIHATKPNEILQFDFLYIVLSRDSTYYFVGMT